MLDLAGLEKDNECEHTLESGTPRLYLLLG